MNKPKYANLVDLLSQRAHLHPERIAFRFFADGENESSTLSYSQLVQDARALAVELLARNLQDRHVLLLYPPGLDFITAFIGCLFARIVPVPAYPPEAHRIKHTLQRLQTIIQDACSPAILTDSLILSQARQLLPQMPDLPLNQLMWLQSDSLIQAGNPLDWRMPNLIKDDLAFLQYTSGSTAQPKGVMISHHNLMVNCEMFQRATGHQEGLAKLVCWVPFYHDMGLVGHLINSLYVGGETLIMPPIAFLKRPFRWLKLISDHQATSTGAPNFAYDLCVSKISAEERAQLDLSSLQFALNAAEPVHASTIKRFTETFEPCGFDPHSFAPSYGMAETTVFISTGRREKRPRLLSVDREALTQNQVVPLIEDDPQAVQLVGCGQTWLDDKLGIVDPETFLVLPEGQIGEIWIQGEHIALGYWNQPELSHDTFQAQIDGYDGEFLRSGDLGFVHQGDVFVTGRIKDLIIIRGRNLYPQDLERSVDDLRSQIPLIRPGCSAAFESGEGVVLLQEISLKITADTIPEGSEKWFEIQAEADKMCQRLAIHLGQEFEVVVQAIVLLGPGVLPKTSSGKIMRQACKQAYTDLLERGEVNSQLKIVFHWQSGVSAGDGMDLRVKPEDDREKRPEDDREKRPEDDREKRPEDDREKRREDENSRQPLDIENSESKDIIEIEHSVDSEIQGVKSDVNSGDDPEQLLDENKLKQADQGSSGVGQTDADANLRSLLFIDWRQWLIQWLQVNREMTLDQIDLSQNFQVMGLDSLMAVRLVADLEETLQQPLPETLLWECTTPLTLLQYIENLLSSNNQKQKTDNDFAASHITDSIQPVTPLLNSHPETDSNAIAIIGMSCRLPGGIQNPEAFWDFLANGRDGISEIPSERWDVEAFYQAQNDQVKSKAGKMYVKRGGFLEQVDQFDPAFFQISGREAIEMDPQQRLLLELSWEALEHAGIPHQSLYQSETGVFIGLSNVDYAAQSHLNLESLNAYSGTGNALSVASGRIAYWLGSQGPTMTIDTACSSSLVAIHQACQSLRMSECQSALAGGANLILSPALNIYFCQLQALAPDGNCKSFDEAADGFVRSEGGGMLFLKRLSDALSQGDRILGLIRSSAVNHDGASNGLTAPNAQAQTKVMSQALKQAKMTPEDLDFIESHGTGTALGDPIEVQAIQSVYLTEKRQTPLYLGAVKSNLGHLESAAGVTSLIKTVLSLQARQIPANLHFQALNSRIAVDEQLKIPTVLSPWPATNKNKPALAAVSSFGISGSNAHLILQEFTDQSTAKVDKITHLNREFEKQFVCLSAHSESALYARIQQLGPFIIKQSQFQTRETQEHLLANLAYTSCCRRSHLTHRWAVSINSFQDLQSKLTETLLQDPQDLAKPYLNPRIGFVFSGQGAQWVSMGRTLLQGSDSRHQVFRDQIQLCEEALKAEVDWSLSQLLLNASEDDYLKMDLLQPIIFAIQVALARLWISWGVEPDLLMGHSMGEVAAAHIAGILTLKDAVQISCRRSRLLAQESESSDGGMLYTGLSPEGCRPYLSEKVMIGVYNSPESTVLTGDRQTLEKIDQRLQAQGVFSRFVQVPVAAHSRQIDRFEAILKEDLAEIQPQPGHYTFVSSVNLPADQTETELIFDGNYWYQNLRQAVNFSQTVQQALTQGVQIWLEISPHPVLLPSIQACARHIKNLRPERSEALSFEPLTLASLKRDQDERLCLEQSLIQLYQAGASVDWQTLVTEAHVLTLPNYPWQRQRYWHESATGLTDSLTSTHYATSVDTHVHKTLKHKPLEIKPLEIKQELFQLQWERSLIPMPAEIDSGHWLVFADPQATNYSALSQTLNLLLKAQGQHLLWVHTGHDLQLEQTPFVIDPLQTSHYQQLIQHLNQNLKRPLHGVIVLSQTLHTPNQTVFEPEHAEKSYWSFKLLLQELEELQTQPSRLFVVTQGAWNTQSSSLNLASLSGLCRTAFYEYPQWHCTQIDLNPEPQPKDYQLLALELLAQSPETQIMIRDSQRFLARLKAFRKDSPFKADHALTFSSEAQSKSLWKNPFAKFGKQVPLAKAASQFEIQTQASYLITGGLGELGLLSARWLVQQGAKYLILISRSGVQRPETQAAINELQAQGAQIKVLSLDMSDAIAVGQQFQELRLNSLPIRGVIHAAGILQDGLIANQSLESLQAVFAPKVAGAWNLHQATLADPLDFFICYSSITATLGMPGQSNYAAANCFLDALVQYRRGLGLPALSVNWGPWHRSKMLANQGSERLMLSHYGFAWLSQDQGFEFLEDALKMQVSQVCVMGVDIRQLTQSLPQTRNLPILNHLARSQAFELELKPPLFKSRPVESVIHSLPEIDFTLSESGQVQAITRANPRAGLPSSHELEDFLLQHIARILGVNASEINTQTSLRIYGFDSLMALELKSQVQQSYALTLKASERFQSMTISEMAERILQNNQKN